MKEGWTYKRIDEVCSIARGGSPRPIKKYITNNPNGLNWIKIGDTDKGGKYIYSTKEKILPEGLKKSRWVEVDEFLLSNSMSFGRPYILKTNGCIHDGWLVLRDYQKYLNIDFFYYVLSSENVQRQFRTKAQGSTVSNLNTERVASVIIPVPSLSEQERIVERLDAAFAQIDELKNNAERQLAEARALFQSALTQAMQPKPGWQEYKIMEIGDVIGGTTPSTSNPNYWGGDKCWISPAELHGEKYLYDSVKKITEEAVIAKNLKLLPEGTVILSSRAPIGKVAINKVPMYCNQGFKCIVCGPRIFNEFLYWWLWGNTDYLNSIGTGATFAEISKTVVQNIIIRIPSKPEQEKIAARLDGYYSFVHRLEHIQNEIITECDALKQALLRQIFE